MKRISLAFFALFIAYSFATVSMAENTADPKPTVTEKSKTEITVDKETGKIRFLIDGKEVVLIDSKGLHITGNVEYSGTIMDTGHSHDGEQDEK